MHRKEKVLMILSSLLGLSLALSTTMVVYDAQTNNASIQDYMNILQGDNMAVLSYAVDPSKTLEVIRNNVCTKLAETKDLKVIVDYSRVSAINSLLDSISQQLHVPHLRMSSAALPEFGDHSYQLQLYPGAVLQLFVLKDFLREERIKGGWDKAYVILPPKSSDLKNFANLVQNVDQPVIIRKWSKSLSENNRMMSEAPTEGVRHFIVGLEPQQLNEFFALASSKQMLGLSFSYILTHPEATSINLNPYAYSGATIMTFAADTKVKKGSLMVKLTKIAKDLTQPLTTLSPWNPRCTGLPWADGQNAMSTVLRQAREKSELMDAHGDLTIPALDYRYDVLALSTAGYDRISFWGSDGGFKDLTRQLRSVQKRQATSPIIRVVTIPSKPFVIVRSKDESGKELTGNEQYTGMSIEIFKKVADKLNLKYEISVVKDLKYGALSKDNTWSGMIGALKRKEADIAVGDLTITSARTQVVDFTSPYLNLGVTVLMKVPSALDSTIDFCAAFRPEVWVLVLLCLVLASLALFVTARLSPAEWYNTDPSTKVNHFTLQDCFWFVSGASLFRGIELMPKAVGTRLVGFVWWLFILLLVIVYAITLQEFIPKAERKLSPIKTMFDLSKQVEIKYGAIASGSTYELFKRSNSITYKRMYEFMVTNPEYMVNSTSQGVERVKNSNGDYAFILESTLAEYYIARNCDLRQVGGIIHPRSFGFALQKGSSLTAQISETLLRYQESGVLETTKNYWLYQYRISTPCELADEQGKLEALNPYLLTRLFVGLILGLIIAIIVCGIELVIRALRPQERGDEAMNIDTDTNAPSINPQHLQMGTMEQYIPKTTKTVAGYLIDRVRLVFCACSGQQKEATKGEGDEAEAQPALSAEGEVTDKDVEKA